ncbi:anti-sigma factor family protein [Burkholderia gladioli]|uniref:anti-sigma factor family protein n=1 Tax=Burkholderia gladioli TaxID=28095 RepID=UPI001FC8E661|nr:hypothetical protein [Burkholderia gladioli]
MKIDDASLLAYVDGELTPQENARIEEAIAASEELASRVAMLRASQLPYGEAFDQQSLPPVPESLTRSVDELIRRHLAGEGASVAAPQATAAAANADDEDSEARWGRMCIASSRARAACRASPGRSWRWPSWPAPSAAAWPCSSRRACRAAACSPPRTIQA